MIRIPAQHNIHRYKRLTPQKVLVHQQYIEFHSPPSLAMIYPAALRHFMANAFYCVAPLHMSGDGGGGRAPKNHSAAKQRSHPQFQTPRTSSSSKNPSNTQATGSRKRTSPRLGHAPPGPALGDHRHKRLRDARKNLSSIAEESTPSPSGKSDPRDSLYSPDPSDDDQSRDLLEATQQTFTTVPETQLPGVGALRTISTIANSAAVASPISQQSNFPVSQGQGEFSQVQGSIDGQTAAARSASPEKSVHKYDPILAESMNDKSFNERLHFFLGDNKINQSIRESVEICILWESDSKERQR
jgi:hypothetical protein